MKVMTTEQVRNVHGGGAISSLGSLAVDAAPVVTALGQFLPSLGNYLQNPKTFNNTGSNRRRGEAPPREMLRNRRKRIDRRSGNKANPECIIFGSGDYQEAGVPDYPRNKVNGH